MIILALDYDLIRHNARKYLKITSKINFDQEIINSDPNY